ncbi:MAG: hypothetical protein VXW27_10085, partial [Pseudomonadota bacterium]|nr:hypothetical protein [Pseudomonadota bacterium]
MGAGFGAVLGHQAGRRDEGALIGGGIGAAAAAHGGAAPASDAATRPRNIIFMVSDGFGPASVTLARVLRNRVYQPPPTESGGMQPL